MPGSRLRTVLDQIREIIAATPIPSPDQDLLRRFVQTREEAAFAELTKRHAAMVFGVCRRILSHSQDAEDACQATFLILARRAGTIRGSVGGWLHSVAWRVARRLKAQRARRPMQELGSIDAPQADATAEVTWREVRLVLDEELQRLPEKYRAPLVLCYLEGMTQDEAARQLGWPSGVLRGRLDRGRERLRTRLTRRGLALSAALFGVGLAESAVAGMVPAALEAGIVRGAHSGTATSGVVSDQVAALAAEVTRTMIAMKLRSTVLMMAALLVVVSLSGAVVYRAWTAPRDDEGKNVPMLAAADGPNEPKPANGTDIVDGLKSLGDVVDPEDVLEIPEGQTRLVVFKQEPSRVEISDDKLAAYVGKQLLLGGNQKGTGTIHFWFDNKPNLDRDKVLALRVRVLGKNESLAKTSERSKAFGRYIKDVEVQETIKLTAGENRLIFRKERLESVAFEKDESQSEVPEGGLQSVRVASAELFDDGKQLLLMGREPGITRLTLMSDPNAGPQKTWLFLVEVAPRKREVA